MTKHIKIRRKYNAEYSAFGFIESPYDKNITLCLLCHKKFSNEAMKPSRLLEHQKKFHAERINKGIEYFQKEKEIFEKRPTLTGLFKKQILESSKGLFSSYEIAGLISETCSSHSVAETLLKPVFNILLKTVLKIEDTETIINTIPLSNDSIRRRIDKMAENVEEQIIEKLKNRKFYIQFDE
ncbi:SCAN domain-containing protein 3 [Dictyocoela muelleri]|nr:SCAN domain-containing protein 3 [Dictyocoela muelleri]